MMAVLPPEARVAIPLASKRLELSEMAAAPEIAGPLRMALDALTSPRQ
jgi:hypothetical protein